MKYGFLPRLMWTGCKNNFRKELTNSLKEANPSRIMKLAHKKYKEIILGVTSFDKGDRFVINILSAAMLSSILLVTEHKYSLEEVKKYYSSSMCNNPLIKIVCKKSKSYTVKGREKLKQSASRSQNNKNPYSWKFEVKDGNNINRYSAIFYSCGICYLMNNLGLSEYIPALCSFDYDMARMNNTKFTREYTLASGGPYCDCNYDHKGK